MPKYYTIYDLAELLQCSDDQVRKLIRVGELATISISMPGSKHKCVRVSQQHLDAFIELRTVESLHPVTEPSSKAEEMPSIRRYV